MSQAQQQKRREPLPYNGATSTLKLSLRCDEANKLVDRTFERTNLSIEWFNNVIDRVADELKIGNADQVIRDKIDAASKEIDVEISRINKIRADNGLEDLTVKYPNIHERELICRTPLAMRYGMLIKKFDDSMNEIDCAWFAELIDSHQRKHAVSIVRRQVNSVSSEIVKMNSQAQKINSKNRKERLNEKKKADDLKIALKEKDTKAMQERADSEKTSEVSKKAGPSKKKVPAVDKTKAKNPEPIAEAS